MLPFSALFRCRWAVSLAIVLIAPSVAAAQAAPTPATTATVAGTVTDTQGHPVAGAAVALSGGVARSASTDARGAFAFSDLPSGIYRVDVTKAGLVPVSQDEIAVVAGGRADLSLALQPASFSSLQTIGRVSVNRNAANAINTSAAAVTDVSAQRFTDQGQLSVTNVLNQTPGIQISRSNGFGSDYTLNAASRATTGIPQIRGALPYETESLIDGHPLSLGEFGTFNPVFISPYVLQDVEVVKGPGASPPNINYAIGGTVNFRTLEPTRRPATAVDYGIDQFGGMFGNVRATGTLGSGKFGYAFDYVTDATQGQVRGLSPQVSPVYGLFGTTINGQPACAANPALYYSCIAPVTLGADPHFVLGPALHAPLTLCCPHLPQDFNQRNELAKLRYNFTPQTSLTVSYLGGQSRAAYTGALLFYLPNNFFTPPAGYTGAVQPGPTIFDSGLQNDYRIENNANLLQAEFRTAIGPGTLLARSYGASVQNFSGGPGNSGTTASDTFTGTLYGGIPLGSSTTPTIFNGVPATVTIPFDYQATRSLDRLVGYSAEYDLPTGRHVVSLSYDQTKATSQSQAEYGLAVIDSAIVPAGSAQTFRTVMVRDQIQLGDALQAVISNHLISYTDHYTQNGGMTFVDATHGYDAPRLALTWRPNRDLAVRGAAGFSVAPPYMNLLTNSGTPQISNPPQFATVSANSGDVRPEVAFGWNLGFDRRGRDGTIVSLDLYQTTLRDQFLQSTTQQGTYTPPPSTGLPQTPLPLFVTKTANLGHSRYEGVEVGVHRDPAYGAGFRLQGALIRAYVYDLPPGFYDTAYGPNTANLAVIANVNFQGTGEGYNGISPSRVPYATGYGELNYRWHNGASGLVGATYYGNNNSFNQLAFVVVNASYKYPLAKRTTLTLSADNVFSTLSNYYPNIFGGIPTPLHNGFFGYTDGNVVGPATLRLALHHDL